MLNNCISEHFNRKPNKSTEQTQWKYLPALQLKKERMNYIEKVVLTYAIQSEITYGLTHIAGQCGLGGMHQHGINPHLLRMRWSTVRKNVVGTGNGMMMMICLMHEI